MSRQRKGACSVSPSIIIPYTTPLLSVSGHRYNRETMKYVLVPVNNQQVSSQDLVNRLAYRLNGISDWPNDVLIERYSRAIKLGTTLLNTISKSENADEKRQEIIRNYEAIVRIIEAIEDEGRRREIVPFIPDEVIEEIFEAKLRDQNNERT